MKTIRIPRAVLMMISLGLGAAVTGALVLGFSQIQLSKRYNRLESGLAQSAQTIASQSGMLEGLRLELHEALQEKLALQAEVDLLAAMKEEILKKAVPKPYRVETYLGKHHLGQAWISPNNIQTNRETGLVSYQPVVYLNENLRHFFTEYRTNTVERQVANYSTYQNRHYNYYPSVAPFFVTPGYIHSGLAVPQALIPNTTGDVTVPGKKAASPSGGGFMPVVRGGSGAWSSPFTTR